MELSIISTTFKTLTTQNTENYRSLVSKEVLFLLIQWQGKIHLRKLVSFLSFVFTKSLK